MADETKGMGVRMRPTEIMANCQAYLDAALYSVLQAAILLVQAEKAAESENNREVWHSHAESALMACRLLENSRDALRDNWSRMNGGLALESDATPKKEVDKPAPQVDNGQAKVDKKLN